MSERHPGPGPDFEAPDSLEGIDITNPEALLIAVVGGMSGLRTTLIEGQEIDRKAQKRRDKVMLAILGLLVLVLVSLALLFVLRFQGAKTLREVKGNTSYLQECTTPGTKTPTPEDPSTGHPCYDRGSSRTGEAINQLNLVSACLALKEGGEEPPACAPVVAALDQLRANQNPFAPPAAVEP